MFSIKLNCSTVQHQTQLFLQRCQTRLLMTNEDDTDYLVTDLDQRSCSRRLAILHIFHTTGENALPALEVHACPMITPSQNHKCVLCSLLVSFPPPSSCIHFFSDMINSLAWLVSQCQPKEQEEESCGGTTQWVLRTSHCVLAS